MTLRALKDLNCIDGPHQWLFWEHVPSLRALPVLALPPAAGLPALWEHQAIAVPWQILWRMFSTMRLSWAKSG